MQLINHTFPNGHVIKNLILDQCMQLDNNEIEDILDRCYAEQTRLIDKANFVGGLDVYLKFTLDDNQEHRLIYQYDKTNEYFGICCSGYAREDYVEMIRHLYKVDDADDSFDFDAAITEVEDIFYSLAHQYYKDKINALALAYESEEIINRYDLIGQELMMHKYNQNINTTENWVRDFINNQKCSLKDFHDWADDLETVTI